MQSSNLKSIGPTALMRDVPTHGRSAPGSALLISISERFDKFMATAKQVAANRDNAQKSTGPKTPEGKAKSSLNAVSHGFAAATYFIEGEDPEEFYGLQIDLLREFQPATHMEQILLEKIVHNQWLSLRAIRLQSDALRHRMELFGNVPTDLGLLIRYQAAADRAFHKAHAELLKAQKEREKSEIGFVSQNAGEAAPAPASTPENTPAEVKTSPAPAPETTPNPGMPPEFVACREESQKKISVGGEQLPQAA